MLGLGKDARLLGNCLSMRLSCGDLENVLRMMISEPGSRERLENARETIETLT